MNEKYSNKWYVGSDSVFKPKWHNGVYSAWVRDSELDAINDAKKLLTDDPAKNEVFIVKIVKVVRRADVPTIVEDV